MLTLNSSGSALSAAFHTAAVADVRRPTGRCNILFTDPFVGSGNTVVTNNTDPIVTSWPDQLIDTKTVTPHKYLVLDGTCDIDEDGTFYLAPGTAQEALENQFGWYSDEVADGSGDFSTPPLATVTFGTVRAINYVRVVGEPTIDQYPVDFEVIVYDALDVELGRVTVTGNSSVEYECDFTGDSITAAKYMTLEITKWSEPDTVSKIVEFFGVIESLFGPETITSMSITEEVEPNTNNSPFGNLSCKTMTLRLQNVSTTYLGSTLLDPFLPDNASSPYSSSITPNVRLDPEMGFKIPPYIVAEYVKMGSFWSRDWNVSQSSDTAEVKAWCRMSILRENKFKANEIPENYTLYQVAEYVLNHAKQYIPLNDLTWSIDSNLSSIVVPYTWFGEVSYMEAIRKIAEAALGRAYFDRNDVLIIESYMAFAQSGSPSQTIGSSLYFDQSRSINPTKTKNYIRVKYNTLAPEDEEDNVKSVDGSFEIGETSVAVEVEWGSDAIITDGASSSISNADGITAYVDETNSVYYPWGATIVVIKSSGTSGTFTVNVSAKKLVLTSVGEYVAYDQTDIDKNNKKEFEFPVNFLIQDESTAATIATRALETLLNPRSEIQVQLPGNPAGEIGDIISVETYKKDSIFTEVRTIRQNVRLDQSSLEIDIVGRETIDYGG